ncbi:Histone acetyltransferase, partial [Globisporangium polare]
IHGVSVLLFGMYVHEFDEQEADCNARRVYISYLDSVNYFEPPHLRTKVYHELLIAYMDFVKQLGFHTAHLWACPPLKGDDYILYCHPESQKTPKSDRLRQWYVDMLVKAQAENVVWQITNMYDDFWRDDNSACALPYFEGDYWVGLAEDLIEKIESEKPKKAKKASTTKRKTAETKKGSKKSKAKKTKRRKTGPGVGENDGENMSDGEGDGDDNDTGDEDNESAAGGEKAKKETPITSLDTVDRTITDPLMKKLGEVIEPMKDDFLVVKLHPCCRVCNTTVLQGVTWQDLNTKTEVCLNPKTVQTVLCDACYQKAKLTPKLQARLNVLTRTEMNIPLKITDPDEVKDSEFFDTRQAFLSLCQGNHYQFDELRRAKHSSMMALYHLGNPNPNAYIYECNACTQDIVTGNRWHCHTCPDFDVCDACYEKEKHEHPLEMIPTSGAAGGSGGANGGGANGAALTEEQRRLREHRAKNVRLHMQLLVHSSSCADGNCGSSNCEKMKELMRHGAQCKLRAYGGCTICRRVWALLQLHARQCRQYECKVPRCHDLREHVRKLQLQQQLMDDRRRAAVTQQYRQMQSGGDEKGGQEQGNGSAEDEPMGA